MTHHQPQTQTGIGTERQGGQQFEGRQTGGPQSGQQQLQATGQQGGQFAGRLGPQQRDALDAAARAIEVCSWCADQCIQEANPHMIECIRLCEDVAELGESTLALVPRQSRFAQPVVQSFQQAVQACAQECSRHQAAHCQECAQVLSQTSTALQSLVQQSGQMASQ